MVDHCVTGRAGNVEHPRWPGLVLVEWSFVGGPAEWSRRNIRVIFARNEGISGRQPSSPRSPRAGLLPSVGPARSPRPHHCRCQTEQQRQHCQSIEDVTPRSHEAMLPSVVFGMPGAGKSIATDEAPIFTDEIVLSGVLVSGGGGRRMSK